MLTSAQIREQFLAFFKGKDHAIVASAPIVVKDDPTLMFTNAGMNQFKDVFLGNKKFHSTKVADTQKCLRVSGKHNDLEEVGVDTYHHTMFEMLGNWSFGDYFKKEAIAYSWELLTEIYKIDKSRIYITVFEGDKEDNLEADTEAIEYWKEWVDESKILLFDRKDNFWEMGDAGPCGPCSEIHVDLRSEEEIAKVSGASLVNMDHPEVIEIWNLVFIEFNRKSDGKLVTLPAKHIDTGMGFERLCMVLQGKKSSYDTDVFTPTINKLSEITGKKYGVTKETDIAFRVIVDHLRAITFTIADGQLPSNTGAGYVIRRILRRAVRYYYNFLERDEPTLFLLLDTLVDQFKNVFPEVEKQQDFISKLIEEEEKSFLRTLSSGLKRLDSLLAETEGAKLNGKDVFTLYDTYGFPVDLTRLIAAENNFEIDEAGFENALAQQKSSSKEDAAKDIEDWIILNRGDEVSFTGYDSLFETTKILKYRLVTEKKHTYTQVVLETTPFYAESGGQQGDKGIIELEGRVLEVFDTKKENDLIVHYVKGTQALTNGIVLAEVDITNRALSCKNHSATHLLHAALKEVLGEHVEQKGSSLNANALRFDFNHFSKVTEEELKSIEKIVNERIFAGIPLNEMRNVAKEEALSMGANALFGEKYGDTVRVIIFDPEQSVELCGGTHVKNTSEIGFFKITHETAVAAGVRRIEAVTAEKALVYVNEHMETLSEVKSLLNNPADLVKTVQSVLEETQELKKKLEQFEIAQWQITKESLKQKVQTFGEVNLIVESIGATSSEGLKKIAYDLKNEIPNLITLLASDADDKALLGLIISDDLVASHNLHAGKLVKDFAKLIQGGGGGQPFFATAGGKLTAGIPKALEEAKNYFQNLLS
ncbi:MAG: alanine--tRNA ligase [Chitinophagales bacterium]